MPSDGWCFNFRTRVDLDDSDDSDDDVKSGANQNSDAAEFRDLNLSSRAETVNYKPNPFSIAKINAICRAEKASSKSSDALQIKNDSNDKAKDRQNQSEVFRLKANADKAQPRIPGARAKAPGKALAKCGASQQKLTFTAAKRAHTSNAPRSKQPKTCSKPATNLKEPLNTRFRGIAPHVPPASPMDVQPSTNQSDGPSAGPSFPQPMEKLAALPQRSVLVKPESPPSILSGCGVLPYDEGTYSSPGAPNQARIQTVQSIPRSIADEDKWSPTRSVHNSENFLPNATASSSRTANQSNMDPPRIARHGCHGAPAWGPRPLPFSSPLRPQAQWQQVDFHDDSHIEDIEDDKAFFSSPARPVPMFEPGFPRHNPANANASRRQSRGINRHRFEPRNPVAPTRSTYQPHNHRMSDGLAIQGGPPMFPKQEIDPPYLDTRFENGPCVMQRPTVQIARTEVEKRIPKSEENGSFHSANPKPTRPVPAKRDPSTSPPHRLNQAEQKKSRAPNAALNARPLVLTTAPPPQKKRARQPARDAYGFGKPDQDEEWSTLPSSKKARLSRVADTRADFRTTGFFQIPGLIPLLPSVDVVKSGKSADSSQRVITFLPPPQKKKGAPAGPAKVDVKPRSESCWLCMLC
ncbi:hypothetical protein CC2G_014824 [Coprinopsis cinerea AmutBmut pab1-1]|nr:hypothetical protein CC2G_014824 [Coprinopsis cinerea AmutBmut pab1-1]